jgi:hypothetical protein
MASEDFKFELQITIEGEGVEDADAQSLAAVLEEEFGTTSSVFIDSSDGDELDVQISSLKVVSL